MRQRVTATRSEVERNVLRSLDNRILKLTVLPTEKCNFRCSYCYEDSVRGIMPRKVVDGLKALLAGP